MCVAILFRNSRNNYQMIARLFLFLKTKEMMKKLFTFMLLLLGAMQGIYAQEPYAVLSNDNTTLTFYYDNNKDSRCGMSVGPFFNTNTGPDTAWYGQCESITSVVFDETFADYKDLTSTAMWFYGCKNLATIIGIDNLNTENVTDMNYMFSSCTNLTSLDLSNFNTANVTSMAYLFYGCSGLTSLDVSNFNTANVTNMASMFDGCSSLTSLDVSNFNTANVTSMTSMFDGCSSLTSLDLRNINTDNVDRMPEMFNGCSKLATIYCEKDWSYGLSYLMSYSMFNGCISLKGAISYDSEKTDVTYANPTTGYFTKKTGGDGKDLNDGDVFTANTVEGVVMTFKVISAKDKTCQVGDGSNASIGNSVSSVTIPDEVNGYNVVSLGFAAFSQCTGLISITIPNSVKTIGGWAFSRCAFTSVTIPNSVTDIGDDAFYHCSSLTSVTIPNSVTNIGIAAFGDCSLTSVAIPNSVMSIGFYAFGGNSVTSIIVEDGNNVYDSRNNCNAIIELLCCAQHNNSYVAQPIMLASNPNSLCA